MAYVSFKQIFIVLLSCFVGVSMLWMAFIRSLNKGPEPLKDFNNEFFCGTNKAQLSDKWNTNNDIEVVDEGKYHIVTNFILVTHRAYSANLLYDGQRVPTEEQLERRQHEIDTTLQHNLNNPHVSAVHVLYYHPAVMMYLMKLRLQNSKKLILHLTRRDPTVGINLDYIQKYLKHKFVILMHQDNFLGEGWEDVDFTALRTHRLMYALTRHAVTNQYPCNAALSASCNQGSMYLGSHDSFAFYADVTFDKDMLLELDIIPSSSGQENVLIWYFRKLKFKVINPCLHLKVYHNHCVSIREKNRQRYNRFNETRPRKNGLAPFTNELI